MRRRLCRRRAIFICMRSALVALFSFFVPSLTSAHEVYLLSPEQVAYGLTTPAFNEFAVAFANGESFLFWGGIAVLAVLVVFGVSIIRPLERRCNPALGRLRRYAAPVARVTLGISYLAAAYFGATYGPELPMEATFGAATPLIRLIFVAIGLCLIAGYAVRAAALIGFGLFAISVYTHGLYMLTYANYFGELVLFLILGAHHGAGASNKAIAKLTKRLAPYSFAILRVCFGIGLFYASFYAKILHNHLALQVASLPLGHPQSLAQIFGFAPDFLVMGAAILELVVASFFILGIEIRFASLFVLFWLALSLAYFGEHVWPHIILVGIPIALICYGYDKYSLEGWLFKRGGREPVL